MDSSDITKLRLSNQRLVGKAFLKASDVVSHLGAVQAQDYAAAKWALGLRMQSATDADIEESFNEGRIFRTHVMRPTWHFVMPEDIRWMLELTAPRVKAFMAHYNRKLELTTELFTKSHKVIEKTLQNVQYATRQELKKELEKIKIQTDVQRLAHIIMWAELDGLICSGPRKGKQFTYALLEKRVSKVKKITREEALIRLAQKYFVSHGPAQLTDFVWWSGLSVKDASAALDFVKSKLVSEPINEKVYWFDKSSNAYNITSTSFLLSVYDEYIIAYKDRSDISEARDIERFLSMGNAFTSAMILDGKAIGTWKRSFKKDTIQILLSPFRKLIKTESDGFEQNAKKYGKFLDMKIEVTTKR